MASNGLLVCQDVAGAADPESVFFIRKADPLIVDTLIANEVITETLNLNEGVLTTTTGGTLLTLNGVPVGGGELDTLTAVLPLIISGTASDEIVSMVDSGVVPGSYVVAGITVNSKGLITSAASGVVPPNDDWSAFPAQSNVNANGFAIQNLQTPTNPQDASTKGYIDTLDVQNVKLSGAQSIGDVKNFLLPPTTNILPTTNNQLCNKLYVDSVQPDPVPLSVVLTTGNSAGASQINMNSNKIVSLLDPTAAQDAATKNYVDNLPPSSTPSLSQVLLVGNSASADINMTGFDIADVNDITMSGLVPTITATNVLGNLVISSAATMALQTAGIMSILAGANLSIGSAGSTTVEDVRFTNNIITSTGGGLEINSLNIITSADGTKNLDFSNPKLFLTNQGSSVVIQNLDVSTTTNTGATLVQTVNNSSINLLGVKNISENSASPGITVTASSAIALTAPTITLPQITATTGATNNLVYNPTNKQVNFQPTVTPTLANVLSNGNQSGANNLVMSFGANIQAGDSQIFAGELSVSQIGPLFPGLQTEIGLSAGLSFPGPIELRNDAQGFGAGLKINSIPESTSGNPNVVLYDPATHQITQKPHRPDTTTLNFQQNAYGVGLQKSTLNYSTTEATYIKNSSINASLDGTPIGTQTWTFGAQKGSIILAGGSSSTHSIIRSTDSGLTWTAVAGSNTLMSSVNGIANNGRVFVLTGTGNNSLMWSFDGLTFNTLGNSIFNTAGRGIIWGNDRFVAVGQGTVNTIATSLDGILWEGRGRTVFSVTGRSVAYNGLRYVVTGDGTNTLGYSDNGSTFIGVGVSIFTASALGVAWGNSIWVACGSGTNQVANSADGINWIGLGSIVGPGRECEWNGERFVIVADSPNTLATSTNGITWVSQGTSVFSTSARSIIWTGMRFLAGGASANNSLARSRDGLTWTPLGTAIMTNVFCFATNARYPNTITKIDNGPVLVDILQPTLALGQGFRAISFSEDGIQFQGVSSPFTIANAAAWSGSQYVAVGTGATQVATSQNGYEWTSNSIGIFDEGLASLWTGDKYLIGGYGNNIAARSATGTNWTTIDMPFFNVCHAFATNGSTIVAGGSGEFPLAYSTNGGISFEAVELPGFQPVLSSVYSVIWSPSLNVFIATGEGDANISTSVDGINWNNTTIAFINRGRGLATNSNIIVIVGSGSNSLGFSTDGQNWTAVNTSLFVDGQSVGWNGRRFVAGSSLGSSKLIFSQNGINWTACIHAMDETFGISTNSRIGPVIVESQLELRSSGLAISNKIDIVSENYFNNGYNNFSGSITT